MVTVKPLVAPTVKVNNVAIKNKEIKKTDKLYEGTRDTGGKTTSIITFHEPVTITFTSTDADVEFRYTLNSKKVNLGSKRWVKSDGPVRLRSNGNGFSASTTTVRVAAFRHGLRSATSEAVFRILTPKNKDGRLAPVLRGNPQTYSQTGK